MTKYNLSTISENVVKISTWNPSLVISNEIFHYVDLSSINKDSKKIDSVQELLGKDAPSRARQLLKLNDILIATVRPNLNGVAIINKEYLNATASTGYCVLRPKPTLDSTFLLYWVQTKAFIDDMVNKASGASYPAISDRIIKESKIPLPPLTQQQKIANILDAADALRQNDKALIAKYDELTQALFLDMFGGYFNSNLVALKEIVQFSQGQQFGVEVQSLEPKEGYGRFLRIVDYTQGDDFRYVPNSNQKYYVKKEDIVIVRYGASAGFVGINKEGVLANNLFKVNFSKKQFNQTFLYFVFKHKRFIDFVVKEAFGAAMPALSFKVMERFEIPIPPITLQKQFAERVALIEEQKAIAQASLLKSEELFNSLLQKAFKGELI